jgi:DNA-binding GntR family transcriptional regulator
LDEARANELKEFRRFLRKEIVRELARDLNQTEASESDDIHTTHIKSLSPCRWNSIDDLCYLLQERFLLPKNVILIISVLKD